MLNTKNIVVFVIFISFCGSVQAASKPPARHWTAAFDQSDAIGPVWHNGEGVRYYPYLHLGHIYGQSLRVSPDGKYAATLLTGEAEAAVLVVFRRRLGRKYPRQRDVVSHTYDDAHGCVWVPHQAHTLVFSTGGADYGVGLLGLWDAPHHASFLRRAKSAAGEGFSVRRVSTDGKWLDYEHFGSDSPDPGDKRQSHIYRRLPQRR